MERIPLETRLQTTVGRDLSVVLGFMLLQSMEILISQDLVMLKGLRIFMFNA